MAELLEQLMKLPAEEQRALAYALLDNLEGPGLTEAQKRELDKRLEEHLRSPETAIAWEDAKAILKRKQ